MWCREERRKIRKVDMMMGRREGRYSRKEKGGDDG